MADEESGEADTEGPTMVISDADADVLVAEAVRRREEQQSGRPMRGQLGVVAGWAVAGLVAIAAGRFLSGIVGGRYLGDVVDIAAVAAGVLAVALAGLLLLRALDLSPATQWGDPAGEPCPACGKDDLREDRVAVAQANGIVALCTSECGYADVRPDPGSPPEPGGRLKFLSRIAREGRGSAGV